MKRGVSPAIPSPPHSAPHHANRPQNSKKNFRIPNPLIVPTIQMKRGVSPAIPSPPPAPPSHQPTNTPTTNQPARPPPSPERYTMPIVQKHSIKAITDPHKISKKILFACPCTLAPLHTWNTTPPPPTPPPHHTNPHGHHHARKIQIFPVPVPIHVDLSAIYSPIYSTLYPVPLSHGNTLHSLFFFLLLCH